MVQSAITVALVPEARSGPFVFHQGLADGCARAAALGFDAVEVFPRSAAELDVAELERALKRHDLRLAALGTGAGWVVHQLRLTDPDPGVRERARGFVADLIDVAATFGAPAIIGSMQGRAEGPVARETALRWLGEALDELGALAAQHHTTLLIEPLNRYETNLLNTLADAQALLATLPNRPVKLLADLFHMNIEERSLGDALRAAGPAIGHVHFADSNRRAPGFGHTDFGPVVAALRDIGYNNHVSAETFPLPDAEIAAHQTMVAFKHWFRS